MILRIKKYYFFYKNNTNNFLLILLIDIRGVKQKIKDAIIYLYILIQYTKYNSRDTKIELKSINM